MKVTQSCPTLCNPMDRNLPGFSVCGIPQARILELVVIPFSRGSSPPRDQTQVSRVQLFASPWTVACQSSVHGILQARILEWVAVSFSRGSSQPRDQTQVSCVANRFFTIWASREALKNRNQTPFLVRVSSFC